MAILIEKLKSAHSQVSTSLRVQGRLAFSDTKLKYKNLYLHLYWKQSGGIERSMEQDYKTQK